MKALTAFSVVLLLTPTAASAQAVPDGIHSESRGPVVLCGLTAANVQGLKAEASASAVFVATPIESPRFELFTSTDADSQLIFTLPSESAYPAATCRSLYEQDGTLRMNRAMRCEAGRVECDALFLEFQELDAQLTQAFQKRD